jgi:hypothetical protein
MKNFFILLILTGFSVVVSAQVDPQMDELMERLRNKRDLVSRWAPYCEDGTQSHGVCPFNDMTIFSGISCLAGDLERCEDVRRAQGPDGRWWRSPLHVGNNLENSFSRDQSKGALAYLVATKDVQAALRWQAYLEANNLRMCPTSTDNRCKITLGASRLFGSVWSYLGLEPAKWMNRGKWITNIYNPIEARFQPRGYPMHLGAVSAWIRREIARRGGHKVEKVDGRVVRVLACREDENPFFLLLQNGPTVEVANLILNRCPDEKPEFDRLDWAWQRDQGNAPWSRSSGHDCVFIINVFERELSLQKP